MLAVEQRERMAALERLDRRVVAIDENVRAVFRAVQALEQVFTARLDAARSFLTDRIAALDRDDSNPPSLERPVSAKRTTPTLEIAIKGERSQQLLIGDHSMTFVCQHCGATDFRVECEPRPEVLRG